MVLKWGLNLVIYSRAWFSSLQVGSFPNLESKDFLPYFASENQMDLADVTTLKTANYRLLAPTTSKMKHILATQQELLSVTF